MVRPDARGAEQSEWAKLLEEWAQSRVGSGATPLLGEALPEFERTLARVALRATHGRRQEAARLLGWGRNTLTRKLKELDLDDPDTGG
jgi:two-component system nitrogen regulation response regulator GlnG